MAQNKYALKKVRRQWNIVSLSTGAVIEGGFFTFEAALACLRQWETGNQ